MVYSSQPEYSGYKLSKGTLQHLSSSLATELGPRGIRVNSVAPSYIYEDVNKAYFDWIASESGRTHEDVYAEKAAPDRPQAARDARRGRAGGAVPGERPGERGDRPDAEHRLRRVPLVRQRDDVGTLDDITAAATRSTGLTDFGDSATRRASRSCSRTTPGNAGLTGVGNHRMRGMVKGLLVAKLMAQQGLAANPDIAGRGHRAAGLHHGPAPIRYDVAATPPDRGPRTPGARAVARRPPAAAAAARDLGADPIFSAMQGGYAAFHEANPELAGLHYSDAASHEECWRLLQHTGRSVAFETQAFTPGYSAWLQGQDWTPAYERHRTLLQLIGMNDPDQRWILKNPSHLVALDAIRTVHPDAVIVVTHRDPVACTASMCSLAAASTRGTSDVFVGDTIGRTQLDLLVREQAAFRASPHSGDVIDVAYGDLVADPLSTLRGVYAAAGLVWSDAAEATASAELGAVTQRRTRSEACRMTWRTTASPRPRSATLWTPD